MRKKRLGRNEKIILQSGFSKMWKKGAILKNEIPKAMLEKITIEVLIRSN